MSFVAAYQIKLTSEGSTRYFTSTAAFNHNQTRLPAFLHKSDTIDPDPHDIKKAVGDINKAVGDINKAVGDINKALGDAHQELPSICSGKEKFHPESVCSPQCSSKQHNITANFEHRS